MLRIFYELKILTKSNNFQIRGRTARLRNTTILLEGKILQSDSRQIYTGRYIQR